MRRTVSTATAALMAATLALGPATSVAAAGPNDADARRQAVLNLVGNSEIQGRSMWFDLGANHTRLDTPEEVASIMDKTRRVNIDTIYLDVKSYTGYVAYLSDFAPHLSEAPMPRYSTFPEGYDLLRTVLDAAHARGIAVHAAMNTFSEGDLAAQAGPAFDHPDWQSTFLRTFRSVQAQDGTSFALTGVNIPRGENQLVLYTPDKYSVSPSNQWGVEVAVVDGVVTRIVDRIYGAPASPVPANGVLLSGMGQARTWILGHLQVGVRVDVSAAENRLVPASQHTGTGTFVNPLNPDVRNYEFAIMREIVENYPIDGIVLDRGRYANIRADFSDLSRAEFEKYVGARMTTWPDDVLTVEIRNHQEEIVRGPYYKQWLEFRAATIGSFFDEAEDRIHQIKPDITFSNYAGSWYPEYWNEGSNWASRTYQPDFDWVTPTYHKTGYSEQLDFFMTGNYYAEITEEEAEAKGNPGYQSVEGSAELVLDATNGATFVYGSLYLLQYKDNPDLFRRAIASLLARTHGVMIFDVVYLELYDWWYILEEEFATPTRAPHTVPGLLNLVRGDE